jgi:membrane protein required for colicin V production
MAFARMLARRYSVAPQTRLASHNPQSEIRSPKLNCGSICHLTARKSVQTYDLLMLVVLIGATVFGFWKGMAWQIASLASLVLSYFAALRFGEQLAPTFGDQAPLNKFVAMLVIYIATSFIIWMLFRFVAGVIDKVRLESFDKQMGAMIGFAKGVLLCIAITFFAVVLLPPAQGEAIVASQSGRYIIALLDKSHAVFPPEVHQVVDPYLEKIEQRLNPNYQPHGNTPGDWPTQAQATRRTTPGQSPSQWPRINWSQQSSGPPQQQWPPMPSSQQQPQPTTERDPYAPREPNPFPYSASRDY